MLNSLHQSQLVNIEQFPNLDANYVFDEGAQLTLGDLHGNALKLLYTLVRHGVIANISKQDYRDFVRLYNKTANEISAQDLKWFNKFIRKIKVNGKGTLRLIGDDLADRGANDYFTLCILSKLLNRTNVEIIVSNHSIEFVRAYEQADKYVSNLLRFGQAASMQNLQQLIDQKLISRKEIDTLMTSLYMPHVKLLSYTLDDANNRLAIFSHAPIGVECIQTIALKLGVAFKDETAKELAQTIENINHVFVEKYVKTKTVHTLFDNEAPSARPEFVDPKVAPFTHLIWNRNHDVNRPCDYKGYHLKWIHGHDSRPTNILHKIYNLDNHLGKGNFTEGPYEVHFTHEKQLGAPKVFDNVDDEIIEEDEGMVASFIEAMKHGANTFVDTFFAPSKHPVIAGAITAAVAVGVSFALGISASMLAACGMFAAISTTLALIIKDRLSQDALQHFNGQTMSHHTVVTKRDAFNQGVDAAKGWIPYAKSYLSTTAWKEPQAFKAGMESELRKPRNVL